MKTPKLIIEWAGDTPISGTCNLCRAVFPAVGPDGESKKHKLEQSFEKHVKAEHYDQPLKRMTTSKTNGQ
jgi:hypothetical protein